ncbi:MAG: hypothetical protein IPM97_10130 [Bdellovibrionaceae bacterium]|nr:hypothetical protein [Pseudobdellovibrionaceae bacterium]
MSKVIFVILGFVVSLSLFPIQSEDLFMYLALAREYFENGRFPVRDPFLLADTNSWTIMHQWLSYFIFYGLYLLGGYSAIIMAKVGFIISILSFPLFWLRKNWAVVFFWGLSVLVGSLAMSFRLVERTSLFSDVFVTLTLGILIKEVESPKRWKYLLPAIFLLWVNLHPGFPTGWVLCGLALVASAKKWRTKEFWHLAFVSIGSVLVCLVNPRGLQGALYPFVFSQQEGKLFRKLYYEWFPTFDPLFFGTSKHCLF